MLKDLSKVKGSYSKVINEHIQELNTSYANDSLEAYKKKVVMIVSLASETPARNNFLLNASKASSKDTLCRYVYDACLCGQALGVNYNGKSYK